MPQLLQCTGTCGETVEVWSLQAYDPAAYVCGACSMAAPDGYLPSGLPPTAPARAVASPRLRVAPRWVPPPREEPPPAQDNLLQLLRDPPPDPAAARQAFLDKLRKGT